MDLQSCFILRISFKWHRLQKLFLKYHSKHKIIWSAFSYHRNYSIINQSKTANLNSNERVQTSTLAWIQRAGLNRMWSNRCFKMTLPVGRATRYWVSLRKISKTSGVTCCRLACKDTYHTVTETYTNSVQLNGVSGGDGKIVYQYMHMYVHMFKYAFACVHYCIRMYMC